MLCYINIYIYNFLQVFFQSFSEDLHHHTARIFVQARVARLFHIFLYYYRLPSTVYHTQKFLQGRMQKCKTRPGMTWAHGKGVPRPAAQVPGKVLAECSIQIARRMEATNIHGIHKLEHGQTHTCVTMCNMKWKESPCSLEDGATEFPTCQH